MGGEYMNVISFFAGAMSVVLIEFVALIVLAIIERKK